MSKWQTKDQLVDLLCNLVHIPSVTASIDEKALPPFVQKELRSLPYFQSHPDHLLLNPTGDGREFVTALVKKRHTRQTIILVSHYDVVDVEDYGSWKDKAFDVKALTKMFYQQKELLPDEVQLEMEAGNWLFGRGTMDMKCGLTLHMSMIEKATAGFFNGNILLLTVPDEEVNSVGMRAAVPKLLELAQIYDLEYKAVLNSEPMFTRYPGDQNNYIYTGTIGKVLPGFLCYGHETHVSEPFSGLNGNYIASAITTALELNTDFCEVVEKEATPPPTNLIQRGLKKEYSVQIPHRAVTLFNLFLFEKQMDEVVQSLLDIAQQVAHQLEENFTKQSTKYSRLFPFSSPKVHIRVLTYGELITYAKNKYGTETVTQIQKQALSNSLKDERDITIEIVDQLAILCKELSPMIILFFAPPYYPAICSRKHPLIQHVVNEMTKYAEERHQLSLIKQNYFGGISDLSYVGSQYPVSSLTSLVANMPMWEQGYSVPLKELEQFDIPVLNLGPIGRDPHQRTERLDINNAFETLFDMLPICITKLLEE